MLTLNYIHTLAPTNNTTKKYDKGRNNTRQQIKQIQKHTAEQQTIGLNIYEKTTTCYNMTNYNITYEYKCNNSNKKPITYSKSFTKV